MITFVPTNSGIAGVCQVVVPAAVPPPPLELLQVTAVTPTLSDAVPEKMMFDAEVDTFVLDGETSSYGGHRRVADRAHVGADV